ncbi:hypothetical protein J7E55_16065, partial [Bacillus sp. ISL-53]|nr:hypothetical protein [Bacillus sp. ISL-53]
NAAIMSSTIIVVSRKNAMLTLGVICHGIGSLLNEKYFDTLIIKVLFLFSHVSLTCYEYSFCCPLSHFRNKYIPIVSLIFCATMENMIYDSLTASTILPVHLQENRLYPLLDLFFKKSNNFTHLHWNICSDYVILIKTKEKI